MRNRDYIYKCVCNYCGSSTDVFCDTIKDEHICSECLDKEDEPEPETEDNYPLDMTYNELAKWRNS